MLQFLGASLLMCARPTPLDLTAYPWQRETAANLASKPASCPMTIILPRQEARTVVERRSPFLHLLTSPQLAIIQDHLPTQLWSARTSPTSSSTTFRGHFPIRLSWRAQHLVRAGGLPLNLQVSPQYQTMKQDRKRATVVPLLPWSLIR